MGKGSKPQSFWQGLAAVVALTLLLGLPSYVYATADNGRKELFEFVRGQIVDLYGGGVIFGSLTGYRAPNGIEPRAR